VSDMRSPIDEQNGKRGRCHTPSSPGLLSLRGAACHCGRQLSDQPAPNHGARNPSGL